MQSQDKRVHIAHFLLIKLNEYCDYNVDMHETVEKHLTVKGSKLSSIRGSIIDFTLKCNFLHIQLNNLSTYLSCTLPPEPVITR